jgi:RNA polymerase sigma-70 factor (ECF subfamily)
MLTEQANIIEMTSRYLGEVRQGNRDALGLLFNLHRERLWRMLMIRIDRRVSGRIDPEDVLQETFIEVSQRIDEYLAAPEVPWYIWVRFLTIQRLHMMQRSHLGAQIRDANREKSLPEEAISPAGVESLAGAFISGFTTPTQAAVRSELQARLRELLLSMDPLDREVLALRHFEELSNADTAQVLGISNDAASKRHIRALKRLKEMLLENA